MSPPRVVIVGAGFGGLNCAKELGDAPVQVTVVDKRNHHTFQPLLYQVATATLNTADIASPIRSTLRHQENTDVILGCVERVDLANRTLALSEGGEVGYDILVVAAGATHSYFGNDGWETYAPGLKTLEDAILIRKRFLYAFERAELERDPVKQREWLTFVIVGAGPTGVELAGALADIAQHTLERDFRHFDPQHTRVLLLEGGPRVLPAFAPELSVKARSQLEKLGVEVRTEAVVTGIDPSGVQIGDERVAARTVIWAAGVAASHLGRALGVPLDRAGRVLVQPNLTIPGHPEVYVIGDLASVKQPSGEPVPGLAGAALQQGRYTAKEILRSIRGEPSEPFVYKDKGSLATIGRAAAVGEIGKLRLSGVVAWLSWLLIHLFFLIGFRNRLVVLFEWALSYATHGRSVRLITGRLPVFEEPPAAEAEAPPPSAPEPGVTSAETRAHHG